MNGSPVFDGPGNEPGARGPLWGPARAPADSPERGESADSVAGPPAEPIAVIPAEPVAGFEEPPAPGAGTANRTRVKAVVTGGVAAFAVVTAVVVVSAVTYRPASTGDASGQALGAGNSAVAYSTYVPTYAVTETSAPSTTTVTYPSDTSVPATSAGTSYSPGAVPTGTSG